MPNVIVRAIRRRADAASRYDRPIADCRCRHAFRYIIIDYAFHIFIAIIDTLLLPFLHALNEY